MAGRGGDSGRRAVDEAWLESKGAVAYEFLQDRVYYVSLPSSPPPHVCHAAHFFSVDSQLVYWNFFLDFGPLNLGQLYRFSEALNRKLTDQRLKDKRIYFYSSTNPNHRSNAAVLICAWSVIYLQRTAAEAYAPFRGIRPVFKPFHDATPVACTYKLTVYDCVCAVEKACIHRFFNFDTFDVEEYEHFEQVENGDLNWLVEGRFLAFAGPHETREVTVDGYQTLGVDDYGPYFRKKGVELVVRLNKRYYDERKFAKYGIRHTEMYYLDGSNPPPSILNRFLHEVEATTGGVAVHCKAGLGRTGTCIGCYIMKHYRLTAAETIGWFRICRPGSVIGPQQHFMAEMEPVMWREGDLLRRKREQEKALAVRLGAEQHSSNNIVHMSESLGSLVLDVTASPNAQPTRSVAKKHNTTGDPGSPAADTKRSKKFGETLDGLAAEDIGPSQGDTLRARRAKHSPGPPVSGGMWTRQSGGSRLVRK